MKSCERCKEPPPVIASGPFAGSWTMHDYCAFCSRDLCDTCMREGRCGDSPNGRHQPETEDDAEMERSEL